MAGAELPEAVRNRLLRRADWRFLLPDPVPARSACFAGGRLQQAVALVSGEVTGAPSPGSCDLAVAVNPRADTLRAARAALRPGGACYTEWHAPGPGITAVRQRLEAAGFRDVAVYRPWPWPGFLPARFWLPLEAPGAAAFARGSAVLHRHPVPGPGSRALRAAHGLLERLGIRGPVCAVARVPAEGDAAPGSNGRPGNTSRLLLTLGPRSVSKAVELTFAGADPAPTAVVKHARIPEAADGLRREAAVLRALPPIPGVPRVLHEEDRGSAFTLGETALAGAPLWAELRRDNYRELALRATDWLIDLARATQRPAVDTSAWAAPVFEEFRATWGPVTDGKALRAAERLLADLPALPRVCEQRDFGPWNVLVAPDGSLGVLDWESAELQGLPGMDLAYFLSYLAFFREGAMRSRRFRPAYRRTLDLGSATGAVRRECLDRYAKGIGLDPEALRRIPLLAWMVHARSEYRHLAADAGGEPADRALRGAIFRGLWEEEVRHATRG